ncbi:MAG: hypothetical protein QXL15_00080 [Candidatus Korarchaeota archaeon]
MPKIREGAVEFEIVDLPDVPTRKMKVFYNPSMKFGRDLTIAIVEAYGRITGRKLRALLPLAGSGIRACRLLRETSCIDYILLNDINPNAVEIARRNIALNNLQENTRIERRDASSLMWELAEKHEKFDYIDIDPFGSPLPFLDAAFAVAAPGSIIGISATDIGTLAGIYAEKALKKYRTFLSRLPIKNEIAVRVLLEAVARAAAAHEKNITPVLSVVSYFVRVFVMVSSKNSHTPGFIGWCSSCNRSLILQNFSTECQYCGNKIIINGPLWVSGLHDSKLTKEAISHSPSNKVRNVFIKATEEISTLSLVDTHYLCSTLNIPQLPSLNSLVRKITQRGYNASRSVIVDTAIRTDAPTGIIRELIL